MKQRMTDEQLERLKCPICKDVDAAFLIYPTVDKRLIKWKCNHLLYKDGTITKIKRKPQFSKKKGT